MAGQSSSRNTSSRSATLRQRRAQTAPVLKPGLTSMAGPGARRARQRSSTSQPPVMSRRGTGGSPVVRRTSPAPRRRYDIALNVPGAEIRLPSMPRVQVGWRLISGLIAAAMLAVL